MSLLVQLYFDKITELTLSRFNSVLFKQALLSLATDSGLHPLVPYFTFFIADEVADLKLYLFSVYIMENVFVGQHELICTCVFLYR